MDLHLAGRHAVVTGGRRGLGYAVTAALAAEGADVAVVSRDPAGVAAAAERLSANGARVVGIAADTTDDASVAAMAEAAAEQLGGVDILVNSAATAASPGGSSGGDEIAGTRTELDTKLLGYLRCARALAPGMVERGWGRIINISGLGARQTGSVAGSVRNVAVAAMAKNLADELGPHGINVTTVHPGFTRTERTPDTLRQVAEASGRTPQQVEADLASQVAIGRLVTAEEVAAVVTFLASPLSVSITGDAIATGGGATGAIYY